MASPTPETTKPTLGNIFTERLPGDVLPSPETARNPTPSNVFTGHLPALVLPFRHDESIDEGGVRSLTEIVLQYADGAVVNGTLGEGPVISARERAKVIELVVGAAGVKPVVAGIGATSTRAAIELVHDAERAGCAGHMVLPPYMYRGSPQELRGHLEAVLTAAQKPCMLYNNPPAYGSDIKPELVAALAEQYPHLVAVKESSGSVQRMTELVHRCSPRVAAIVGLDNLLLEGVRAGAVGWVSGISNAYPNEVDALYRAAISNDRTADARYKALLPLLRLDALPTLVQWIKELAQWAGNIDSVQVRAPRQTLNASDRGRLQELRREFLNAHAQISPVDSR